MKLIMNRRHTMEMVGAFLAVALVAAGVWFFVQRADRSSPSSSAGPPVAPTVSPTTPPGVSPSDSPETMTVNIYFHKGQGADPAKVVAVARTVPKTPMVATAALTQLLAGPTSAERGAGYWSHFSVTTAGMLRSVRVGNGVAHADFRDFRQIIPNARSSAGSVALLAELDATLKQFATVRTTVYSFDGTVAPFYEWLQLSPPVGMRPGLSEARTVARAFMVRIAGMVNPRHVGSRYISDWLASVDFRSGIPGDSRPTAGPITTVLLSYGNTGFHPIWATTDTIVLDTPTPRLNPADITAVTSPVSVSGRARAWEGAVNLRVVQDNGLTVRRLGEGYATGGSDEMRPFSAQVPYAGPSTSQGWLVASEMAEQDGEVYKVAAVRLVFAGAPAQPGVTEVRYATNPTLPEFQPGDPLAGVPHGGWAMPTGPGTITFTIRGTSGTARVQVLLTPLGGGTTPTPRLLGTATRSGATFTYIWRYADQPLLARITLVATSTTGRGEFVAFNVFHS